jgi:hypothetical protein
MQNGNLYLFGVLGGTAYYWQQMSNLTFGPPQTLTSGVNVGLNIVPFPSPEDQCLLLFVTNETGDQVSYSTFCNGNIGKFNNLPPLPARKGCLQFDNPVIGVASTGQVMGTMIEIVGNVSVSFCMGRCCHLVLFTDIYWKAQLGRLGLFGCNRGHWGPFCWPCL